MQAMSQATSNPSRPAGSSHWFPIVGWTIIGVLAAILLCFIATVMFGGVHGLEFCPQTFERRSYSYYELPILRLQVTGERNDDLTGDTEQYVALKGYVSTITGKKDWHVLVGSHGTRLRRPGDAGILIQYLDAEEKGDTRRWVQWSEKNVELAKILWPAVQRLALNEAYVFVPDLFELAKAAHCEEEFQEAVKGLLKAKLPEADAESDGDEK